jgi:Domain of unknown function (DUF4407)
MKFNSLAVACSITGSDLDIAEVSSGRDRANIRWNAFSLVIVTVLAFTAWTTFLSTSLPLPAALLGASLVASIQLCFDRAFAAADWDLAGVLKSNSPTAAWWVKVILRVLLSIILSFATSYGLLLKINEGAIDDQLQRDRAKANTPLREEYKVKLEEATKQLVAPTQEELDLLITEQKQLQGALSSRESTLATARDQASKARIEADREKNGGISGYAPGEGGKFKDAKRQELEATTLAAQIGEDSLGLQRRLAIIDERMGQLRIDLKTANKRLSSLTQKYEADLKVDPRWMEKKTDLLSRYNGLQSLRNDPVNGASISFFTWLFNAVLLALELSFIFIKLGCASASVYTVRLIAQTKFEAVQVAVEYEKQVAELRYPPHDEAKEQPKARPSMRIV